MEELIGLHEMQPANRPPRNPTSEELNDLLQWQIKNKYSGSPSMEEIEDDRALLQRSWIGVFDDYASDCPGCAGRVMFVVWPAGPSTFHVFTWDENGSLRANPCDAVY